MECSPIHSLNLSRCGRKKKKKRILGRKKKKFYATLFREEMYIDGLEDRYVCGVDVRILVGELYMYHVMYTRYSENLIDVLVSV